MSVSPTAQDHTDLQRVIREQVGSAESMIEILDQEYQALLDGDTESLNKVSAEKARVIEDLETLERARQDLAETGQSDRTNASSSNWSEVLDLIKQCRERNQRNGALANARREQVLLALNVLRGSDDGVYDESGAVARQIGARALGEA
ncbi:MAG: flagellar protein FlgN [Gammaproteobacteria bacterium]|nr:flagellar protein FlgN [Gammaproteobacteria bacterium]